VLRVVLFLLCPFFHLNFLLQREQIDIIIIIWAFVAIYDSEDVNEERRMEPLPVLLRFLAILKKTGLYVDIGRNKKTALGILSYTLHIDPNPDAASHDTTPTVFHLLLFCFACKI